MKQTDSVQAAIAQANRLNAEAELHKSQAEYHRREAKRKRIALAKFIERCQALGITVVIQPSTPMSLRGDTSGHEDQASQSRPASGQHPRDSAGEREAAGSRS